MAVLIDERARALIRSRRDGGKPASLWVHRVRARKSGWTAVVDWTDGAPQSEGAAHVRLGDTSAWVDAKIAAYARWQPVVLTAAESGPLRSVVPADPVLMFHIGAWEASHPGLRVA